MVVVVVAVVVVVVEEVVVVVVAAAAVVVVVVKILIVMVRNCSSSSSGSTNESRRHFFLKNTIVLGHSASALVWSFAGLSSCSLLGKARIMRKQDASRAQATMRPGSKKALGHYGLCTDGPGN